MGNAIRNANSPQEVLNQLPPITKVWFVGAVIMTAAVSFGLASPQSIAFLWPYIWHKFEIWRFLTTFLFVGKFSLGFLFQIMMLVNFSWGYEVAPFRTDGGPGDGTSADYMFAMLFCGAIDWVLAYLLDMPFLAQLMLYSITYLWSRKHPNEVVTLMFGIRCTGLYLPWYLMAFSICLGNSIAPHILAVLVGHVFYYITQIKPMLRCPQFLHDVFDTGVVNNPDAAGGDNRGAFRGQGYRL
jgi:Derlin-2/3